MAKIFDPDSTLNPPFPKVAIYPFGAFNDSILLAKFVGNTRFSPRLKYIEHTVALPRNEKKNLYSTSICASVFVSNPIPLQKNFKWGALMRPSWSKQLSVPCNNFNDSFLLVLFKHFTGFQNLQKTQHKFQSEGSSDYGNNSLNEVEKRLTRSSLEEPLLDD